jgi:hypothetical protein
MLSDLARAKKKRLLLSLQLRKTRKKKFATSANDTA